MRHLPGTVLAVVATGSCCCCSLCCGVPWNVLMDAAYEGRVEAESLAEVWILASPAVLASCGEFDSVERTPLGADWARDGDYNEFWELDYIVTPTCDVTVFVIYEGDNLVVSGASIATLDGTEDIGTTYIDWYSDEGGGGGGDWDWD
jgi:hypothetical protein